jgi:hypothetical protein
MGLLFRAFSIRRLIMKIANIDNPTLSVVGTKALIIGRKIILIPFGSVVIHSGTRIPYIKIRTVLYKYCPKCKSWKTLSSFCGNKSAVDGLKDKCRNCDNKARRERYAKTKAVT